MLFLAEVHPLIPPVPFGANELQLDVLLPRPLPDRARLIILFSLICASPITYSLIHNARGYKIQQVKKKEITVDLCAGLVSVVVNHGSDIGGGVDSLQNEAQNKSPAPFTLKFSSSFFSLLPRPLNVKHNSCAALGCSGRRVTLSITKREVLAASI